MDRRLVTVVGVGALVFASCSLHTAPTPLDIVWHRTPCGMEYKGGWFDSKPVPSLAEQLDQFESQWLSIFSGMVTDPRFSSQYELCRGLQGYQLWTRPQAWGDEPGYSYTLIGLTTCWTRNVEIVWEDRVTQTLKDTSLSHELGHVAQNCTDIPPSDNQGSARWAGHANWFRDHIDDAVSLMRTSPP